MAMIKCKECGQGVSTKATSCPHCGIKLSSSRERKLINFFIILMLSLYVISKCTADKNKEPTQSPKTPAELRNEEIAKCFSSWDGSHRNLEKIIKASMNDPQSYEHEETTYWDLNDHLIVRTTFRGKNAFGGTVKNWVRAKMTISCDLIDVIEQGP